MSERPLVRLHVHEHTATLVLDRPEKRNALSRELLSELAQLFDDLRQERRVSAVIVSAAGSAFCAGMDLDEMLDTSQQPDAAARWQADVSQYLELIEAMLLFPKPLIAAVGGAALAGGAGLVLACDLVVADEHAQFGLPEPHRGLVAAVIAPLLTFRIGAGQAAYLLLSGQTIDSSTAFRLGLFHEQVAADQLWLRAMKLASQCALAAPQALLLTKRMLNETIGEQLGALLSAGAALSAAARTTEAALEGLRAFREKRVPQWP